MTFKEFSTAQSGSKKDKPGDKINATPARGAPADEAEKKPQKSGPQGS